MNKPRALELWSYSNSITPTSRSHRTVKPWDQTKLLTASECYSILRLEVQDLSVGFKSHKQQAHIYCSHRGFLRHQQLLSLIFPLSSMPLSYLSVKTSLQTRLTILPHLYLPSTLSPSTHRQWIPHKKFCCISEKYISQNTLKLSSYIQNENSVLAS